MSAFRLRGFFGVASALAMATTVFIAGCSEDSVKPPDEFAAPSNLAFENREASIRLTWSTSFDDGNFTEFAGYNIYRDTASMVNLDGSELATKKLNSAVLPPGTVNFTDTTPVLGDKYYYGVRAARDNGDLSVSSNEIDTAIFVQGEFSTIFEFMSPGESGFNAALGKVISLVSTSADSIDFYLGTDAEGDAGTGALQLESPSQVSDSPPWNSRVAGLKLLDTDASFLPPNTTFQESIALGTTVEQVEDKIIAIKLPPDLNGETHYAKIEILTFNNDGAEQRSIVFTYRYQPIAAYARF